MVDEEREREEWTRFDERVQKLTEQEGGPPEEEEPPSAAPVELQFDERWHEGFNGLTYLGRLERTFDFAGHEFTVKSLTTGEKIEAQQIAAAYEASQLAYLKAYRAAIAAGGILLADGEPIPVPERKVGVIRQRWNWMIDNWHDPVIDAIYENVMYLEEQVLAILNEMGAFDTTPEVAVRIS